jgi:hypothetical protein
MRRRTPDRLDWDWDYQDPGPTEADSTATAAEHFSVYSRALEARVTSRGEPRLGMHRSRARERSQLSLVVSRSRPADEAGSWQRQRVVFKACS